MALLLVMIGGVYAQPAAEPPSARLDTVTVEANRNRAILEQRINSFVSAIATHTGEETLARWQVPVCPLVLGLPVDEAEFVVQRLSRTMRDAGVILAPRPCGGNFLVVLPSEPEELLKQWAARYPRMFNDDRGVAGIKRFVHTGEAVRIWYNACSQASSGARQSTSLAGLNCNTGQLGSSLTHESVRVLFSVIVVVDLGRIDGLKFGQLTDYIAMIGLVQLRIAAGVGDAPTILRLFTESADAKPSGLSTWDQALLKSAYSSNAAEVTQISQMKHRMAQDLAP